MEQTSRIFGATEGTFLLLERDESALVVTFSQTPSLRDAWYAQGQDLFWQTVQTGKPVFVSDLVQLTELDEHDIYREVFKNMQSAVLLPLNTPDRNIGVLCFTFAQAQEFSTEDQRIFTAISEIAGTALRRAAVLESLERQVATRSRYLSTLYEISAASGEPIELELLLERMLGLTLSVMNSSTGTLHLIDSRGENQVLTVQKGLSPDYQQAFSNLSLEDPFWQRLVNSSEPILIPDLRSDSRAPLVLKASPYAAYLAAPLRVKRQAIGLLSLFGDSILEYTIEDITLFTTIAEQLGSAVERSRLQKQAEQAAVAEERQRLARDLHDSVSQLIYSLVLYAGAGRKVLKHGDLKITEEYLEKIDQTSQQALRDMRLLVYELRPSVFREEGLIGALNRRLQAVEKRTGMTAQLLVNGQVDMDEATELALYRIAEEALNNTLKHAKANAVQVRIDRTAQGLDLTIEDDGCGFDLIGGLNSGGLGLVGIQERVHRLGGQLQVRSAPGEGTKISIHVEVAK
jgi:signal transduction histidine kinase